MLSYQRAWKEILLWSGVTRANRSTSPQPDDDHDYYWIWWSWWWWWQWWNYGGKQQENDDWMIITIPPHLASWSSSWSSSWKASPWGDEDRYSKKTGNHHSEWTCAASLEMMIIVMTITTTMMIMMMMIMIDLFTCTATAIPSTPAVWRTDLIFRRRRVLMISNHYDDQDGLHDHNDHDYHL